MEYIDTIVAIIVPFLLGLFIHKYLPKYFEEKAKNLATKEDIGEITKEVEEVKNIYKNHYDLSRTEREFYEQMVKATQKFLADIKRYELEKGTGENSATKEVIMSVPQLRENFLLFVDSANEIFAKAFVFLGEESYQRLKDALEEKSNFAAIRLNLLDAMRGSIYPETSFRAVTDTWDLKY
ncbi:MAG: hypothetical protein AAB575_00585 [Patescibacteria group bacterium]